MEFGLSDCIRCLLEQQKISQSSIISYMKGLSSLSRYESAFKKLLFVLQLQGVDLKEATVVQIAEALLLIADCSLADARCAYSAALLLPGFSALRFCPLLSQVKKKWSVSVERYATFWDPTVMLQKLCSFQGDLSVLSVEDLRKRLILCWRLLALHRGVDLSRTQRKISFVGEKVFILVQRKGWKFPKWEEVLILKDSPQISPFHLLMAYVQKTNTCDKSFLLWSLDGRKPLSANRINSLTRESMHEFGVDTAHWKPHSTRGAGVLHWKKMGLSQEEIQQLGQWKNFTAFQAHYLRLGVAEKAQKLMKAGVHKTSPGLSAESDWSRTPGRYDPGGRDREDEAQRQGEPNPHHPKRKRESPRGGYKRFRPPGGPLQFKFAKVSETSPPTPAPKTQ